MQLPSFLTHTALAPGTLGPGRALAATQCPAHRRGEWVGRGRTEGLWAGQGRRCAAAGLETTFPLLRPDRALGPRLPSPRDSDRNPGQLT